MASRLPTPPPKPSNSPNGHYPPTVTDRSTSPGGGGGVVELPSTSPWKGWPALDPNNMMVLHGSGGGGGCTARGISASVERFSKDGSKPKCHKNSIQMRRRLPSKTNGVNVWPVWWFRSGWGYPSPVVDHCTPQRRSAQHRRCHRQRLKKTKTPKSSQQDT